MEILQKCPDCGAVWQPGQTCQDYFYQMLFWEADNPDAGLAVHHLMVLSYHLQHPGLYSPEGLAEAKRLLVEFVEHGASPVQIRKRNRAKLDSGNRKWKIRGSPDSRGSYQHPIQWTMTAARVVAGGPGAYEDNVKEWAQSIEVALESSSNLSTA